MRVGDFSVEVVAPEGDAREIESGHVLARPGQVYVLRLRNHGPLRCVADVSIDGNAVTGGGLVINAWSAVDLERPIHATERGRFTVIAEGDERVFGPDGGRDNVNLGLIEARFRRELPNTAHPEPVRQPSIPRPIVAFPSPPTSPAPDPRRPFTPPEWTPPSWGSSVGGAGGSTRGAEGFTGGIAGSPRRPRFLDFRALMAPSITVNKPVTPEEATGAVEGAAGTGLTGSSDQEFVPVSVGTLETEATVIRLRLVIGSEESLSAPRPLPVAEAVPARPLARP